MKNVIIGAVVGAVVGAGVSGAIVGANADKMNAAKPATAATQPAAATQPTAAKTQDKHKVVYHINYAGGEQNKLYHAAMTNIQNHISAIGANKLDIKVVMHGLGLDILKDAKEDQGLRSKVQGLKNQHVSFEVCGIALERRKINYKDLYDVAEGDIVPSGVAEIAKLQHRGYAYIKP
ncbi:MAG: DsrE family protein [Rhodospirillales bacterium]|nr:DsrE family protein [Rhodospirillales bacterium]